MKANLILLLVITLIISYPVFSGIILADYSLENNFSLTTVDSGKIQLEPGKRKDNNNFNQQKEKRKPKSFGQKLWAFLNAPFILWILSAIILTFLPKLMNNAKEKVNEKRRKKELIRLVDLELRMRFHQCKHQLDNINHNWGEFKSHIMAIQNLTEGRSVAAVAKEFSMMPTLTLLLQFENVIDESHKPQIRKSIKGVTELQALMASGWGDRKMNATPEEKRTQIMEAIRSAFAKAYITRWVVPEGDT